MKMGGEIGSKRPHTKTGASNEMTGDLVKEQKSVHLRTGTFF